MPSFFMRSHGSRKRRELDNAERLAAALNELGARVPGAPGPLRDPRGTPTQARVKRLNSDFGVL